jgi:hypothetical protein
MHLPPDVNLDEIDFEPLPEPGNKPLKRTLCAPESGANVPEVLLLKQQPQCAEGEFGK